MPRSDNTILDFADCKLTDDLAREKWWFDDGFIFLLRIDDGGIEFRAKILSN